LANLNTDRGLILIVLWFTRSSSPLYHEGSTDATRTFGDICSRNVDV
jgi:hypothetical protein